MYNKNFENAVFEAFSLVIETKYILRNYEVDH